MSTFGVVSMYLLLSPLLLLIAGIFKAYPPRKINHYYGYRTKRSMSSEQAWKMANDFSSTLLLLISIGLNVFQAACFLFLKSQTAFLLTGIGITIGVVLIIPLTEIHVRKNIP